MAEASPQQPDWSWEEMLEAFRALGGAAQNIILQRGQLGRGLFALNTAEPVLLRVPQSLLIRVDDIEFTDGKILIRQSAGVPEDERRFFERYQDAFSWGAGGKSESVAHITALESLPAEIRELLVADFGFEDLLPGDSAQRVQNHFLRSRRIHRQHGHVLAPLLELANHDTAGLRYEWGTHLQIQGYVRDEILVHYGAQDTWSTFDLYGFLSREPAAFSLAMNAHFDNVELAIGRDTGEGVRRGKDRIPKIRVDGSNIALSYLMLGHQKFPRLPRGTFRTLLREAGMNTPDEAFDHIRRINALKFIKLLKALEPYEGEMIGTLRTIARYQLEAMAHCIGSRELGPATHPVGQVRNLSAE